MVELGKKRGLIKGPGEKVAITKDGEPVSLTGNLRSVWMDITPKMAADWLKNNFGNRPLKNDVVHAYARDMINGVWVPTHQGLAFNDQDELIDVQHRLRAIVLSGKTIRMMVTFGLPSRIAGKEMTTMDAVDRGATRSVADQLTIQHGFKNGGKTAQICSALAGVCFGERTRRLSVGQTLEVYRAFESAVLYVIEHGSTKVGLRAIGVPTGFAFALITEERFWENTTKISTMYNSLMTGEGLADGSAIKQLHGFLTSEESALFTRTLDRGLAELVLQAIWLDLAGKRVTKLEPGAEGKKHFVSLQTERVAKVAELFKLPGLPKPEPKPVKEPKPVTPEERNQKIYDSLPPVPKPHRGPGLSNGRVGSKHRHEPKIEPKAKPVLALEAPTAKELEWRKLRGETPAAPVEETYQ